MANLDNFSHDLSGVDVAKSEVLNLAELFLDARLHAGDHDRPALIVDDRTYTYAQVQRAAAQQAQRLLAAGLRPEERVAIALDDGLAFVATFFATLKLGAVVLMLNPELQPSAACDLLRHTVARYLVTTPPTLHAWSLPASLADDGPVLLTCSDQDFDVDDSAALTQAWLPARTHRDDSAIWLLSGGTTGRPKVVMQTHGSFVNTTQRYALGVLGLRASDRTISVPKLYFGYATGSNLLFPFAVGATSILYTGRTKAALLCEQAAKHRATVMIGVPTMLGKILELDRQSPVDLSTLRLVTSAGEALPLPLHQAFGQRFAVDVLDGLGTAEMWHIFLSNRPDQVAMGTVGQVVDGFAIKLCDDDGREVAPGEVGWLWVRGNSRALGYWRNLAASQLAFRGEWYISGDMLQARADGAYVYCGRGDDMLKVSGKWLAPAEVEACLAACEGIEEAVVVGANDEHGLTKAYAFVVIRDRDRDNEHELASERLLLHCRARLEPYKVPRAIHPVRELPRTHLGKADRAALRQRIVQARLNALSCSDKEP